MKPIYATNNASPPSTSLKPMSRASSPPPERKSLITRNLTPTFFKCATGNPACSGWSLLSTKGVGSSVPCTSLRSSDATGTKTLSQTRPFSIWPCGPRYLDDYKTKTIVRCLNVAVDYPNTDSYQESHLHGCVAYSKGFNSVMDTGRLVHLKK